MLKDMNIEFRDKKYGLIETVDTVEGVFKLYKPLNFKGKRIIFCNNVFLDRTWKDIFHYLSTERVR